MAFCPYEFSMGFPWKTHGIVIPWNHHGKFIRAKPHVNSWTVPIIGVASYGALGHVILGITRFIDSDESCARFSVQQSVFWPSVLQTVTGLWLCSAATRDGMRVVGY